MDPAREDLIREELQQRTIPYGAEHPFKTMLPWKYVGKKNISRRVLTVIPTVN
jgi:hypothetical protein